MSHLTQDFIAQMKQKLQEEKTRLETDIAGLEVHTDVGDDEDENASEIVMDEVNSDLRGRMEADIEKIDKALAKIEDGTYGVDDEGKEISEARLNAIPWADKAI